MEDSNALRDRVVIVTGAAGGLGKAIAVAYLEHGARVSICDIDATRLELCKTEWADRFPDKFLVSRTDICDKTALETFFEDTVAQFGRLDILINNAGVLDDFSPAGDCADDIWDRTLAVNLKSAFLATKLAVRLFSTQEPTGGVIINIGSESSVRPTKSGVAYAVSKHGLDGLTKHTANYYGSSGISCMCLLLGAMVGTNIYKSLPGQIHASFAEKMKNLTKNFDVAKQSVSVESVAQFCLFLSRPDIATGSNGSCLEFRKNWTFQ